ncbi:MAG: hypothetical protein HZA46_23920 [Planctomycetales bacterium]|nr:hypothetical protein [Planctomycetales bacterium]
MNSSFRTAFRVLVLSLIIPLAAVVLAELAPGALSVSTMANTNRAAAQPAPLTARKTARQPAPAETTPNDQLATQASRAKRSADAEQPAAPSRPTVAVGNTPTRTVSRTNKAPSPAWTSADSLPDADPPPLTSDLPRRSVKQRPVTLQPIEEEVAGDSAPYQQLASHLTRMQRSLDQLSLTQQQSQQIGQATQVLQQLQQQTQMAQLETQIKELKSQAVPPEQPRTQSPNPADSTAPPVLKAPGEEKDELKQKAQSAGTEDATEPKKDRNKPGAEVDDLGLPVEDDFPRPSGKPKATGPSVKPLITKVQPADDGSERFSLQLRDAEIGTVLEMLGEFSGTNILASKEVTGKVSFNLHDVTIDEALDAILKMGGYIHTREGNFVYVTTAVVAEAKAKLNRKIVVKVYRPYYISSADFQALLSPILTPTIGKISVTTPSQTGVTGGGQSGGDSLTQRDALLIQDYA